MREKCSFENINLWVILEKVLGLTLISMINSSVIQIILGVEWSICVLTSLDTVLASFKVLESEQIMENLNMINLASA